MCFVTVGEQCAPAEDLQNVLNNVRKKDPRNFIFICYSGELVGRSFRKYKRRDRRERESKYFWGFRVLGSKNNIFVDLESINVASFSIFFRHV